SSTLRLSHNRLTMRRSPGIPSPCQPEPHASTACSQSSSDCAIQTMRLLAADDLLTWVMRLSTATRVFPAPVGSWTIALLLPGVALRTLRIFRDVDFWNARSFGSLTG